MPHKQKNVQVVLDKPAVTAKIGKDSVKMHFRCKKSYKDYTYEEISKFFDKPIKDVSEELGVSVTFLKKVCRRLNIPRWPFRKISALHKRITQIEETISEQVPSKTQVELLQKQQMLKNSLSQVIERTSSSASLVSFSSQASLADLDQEENYDEEDDDEDNDQQHQVDDQVSSDVAAEAQPSQYKVKEEKDFEQHQGKSVQDASANVIAIPTPRQPEESRIINHLQCFQPRNAVANYAAPIYYQAQQQYQAVPQQLQHPYYYAQQQQPAHFHQVPNLHAPNQHYIAPQQQVAAPVHRLPLHYPAQQQQVAPTQQQAPQRAQQQQDGGMKKLPSFGDLCKFIGV